MWRESWRKTLRWEFYEEALVTPGPPGGGAGNGLGSGGLSGRGGEPPPNSLKKEILVALKI